MDQKRILIIEDDAGIAGLLQTRAERLGADMEIAADGAEGLRRALGEPWDLIVLDLSLPKLDGIDLCRQLRAAGIWLPILMLTSRDDEIDRVLGLEVGADDYVTKPFGLRELEARMRALLRRAVAAKPEDGPSGRRGVRYDDLELDFDLRRCVRAGQRVELTPIEWTIIAVLLSRPGKIFSRDELVASIWGEYDPSFEAPLTKHLSRLRKKLGDDVQQPRFIHTAAGLGYRWGR